MLVCIRLRLSINPRTAKMQDLLMCMCQFFGIICNMVLWSRKRLHKSIFAYFVKSLLPYLCTPTEAFFSSACVSRSLTACRKILFRQAEQLHPTFQSGAIALGKYMKTKIAILKELFCSCDYILMVFCKLNINLPSVSATDSAYRNARFILQFR